MFLFAALIIGGLPVWTLLAALVDSYRWVRRRTPFAVTRLILFGAVYLAAEILAVNAMFLFWLFAGFGRSRHARMMRGTYVVQAAWVGLLLGAVKRLYGVRLELENEEVLGPTPGGPAVVLMQHTSLVDTMLPTSLLTTRRGLKLRWVLKQELLKDPALDIGGTRLHNLFVSRDGSETERSMDGLRTLATDLAPDEGVLIYPEGTRFTADKRLRALARLAKSAPAFVARAERLRRVLPPRLGGALTILETAREADIVLVGHVGFEGLSSVGSVLSGDLVGRVVRMRYWRIPRREVPVTREALIEWLWARWEELDAWVDATLLQRKAAPAP